jgi:hypothetical protein
MDHRDNCSTEGCPVKGREMGEIPQFKILPNRYPERPLSS